VKCLKASEESGIELIVLDRPNPLNGIHMEGNVVEEGYLSIVGIHPLPVKYALTVGELARLIKNDLGIDCQLDVIRMRGWTRRMWYDETGLKWINPSPNIPSLESAMVYPGSCLLEGTNISEGRGTTRPFQIIGAPFIDPFELEERLNGQKLKGVIFRATYFKPWMDKWAGRVCGGVWIHVLNRMTFKPFLTGIAIVKSIYDLYRGDFKWRETPYEFRSDVPAFDLLAGCGYIREMIQQGASLEELENRYSEGAGEFIEKWKMHTFY
jgi:uncharacterized protein YbbC (DUF1343 family)